MSIKVLVTGGHGLVGSDFVAKAKGYFTVLVPSSSELNICDTVAVKSYLDREMPDYLINFAAFTDVNKAEFQSGDKSGTVWAVNVQAVENLCQHFQGQQIIQISTDMVFSGTLDQPGPYLETSRRQTDPSKLTWYGYTKSQAEQIVLDHGHSVLRITYPVRSSFPSKLDYIRSFLDRYKQQTIYPSFTDQQICVSYIDEVSLSLIAIINGQHTGIFHCASDSTSPYELVTYTLDQLNLDSSLVPQGSVVDFLVSQANPYRYPQYGGLNSFQTSKRLGIQFATWQTVVERLVAEGLEY